MRPPPSQWLPSLQPLPSFAVLTLNIKLLSSLYDPQDVVISLLDDGLGSIESEEQEGDEFETQFVRSWLENVVRAASKVLAKGAGEESWSEILDKAAGLLASMSGHSAAGPSSRTYLLPTASAPSSSSSCALQGLTESQSVDTATSSLSPPTLALKIRDTTLLSSSTGHRTWGSASLLARQVSLDPASVFPDLFNDPTPSPLRVLELGSGTGLVGLTVASTLKTLLKGKGKASVDLTDFEDPILENLEYNLGANEREWEGVEVSVRRLDWSTYASAEEPEVKEEKKYDFIFGADIIYEPSHLPLVLATVSSLLRLPRHPSSESEISPTFHLLIPLRPTHTKEHDAFDDAFSDASVPPESSCRSVGGRKWRLATKEKWELSGEDSFAKGENSVKQYRRYKIEWKEML